MDLAQAVSQLISVVADLIAKNDLYKELAAASMWGNFAHSSRPLYFPTPQAEASTQTLVAEVRGVSVCTSAPDPFVASDPWKSYKGVGGAGKN